MGGMRALKASWPMIVALQCLGADVALSQSVGVFFDPEGTSCERNIRSGDSGTLWILARGVDLEALVGAEFRVSGFPSGWSVATNHLDNGVAMDYGLEDGVILGLFSDRTAPRPAAGTLALWSVHYQATSDVPETILRVEARARPTNPSFVGPVLVLQREPTDCVRSPHYEVVPAVGLEAVINGRCTIAADSRTWQQVKELYRE